MPVSSSHSQQKISVAVVGASGYTGIELVRLLLEHPHVHLAAITSRQFSKKSLSQVFPHFTGHSRLKFEPLSVTKIAKAAQVVFLCLPHHESMDTARKFREYGVKVIDLSADFRFSDVKNYEALYGPHTQHKLLKEASYGLCELFAHDIQKSFLVGVPGCYVTSILLALAPLMQNQIIVHSPIICDAKSGTSGAGRSANTDQLFSEIDENFYAYALASHRHGPEIEEKLSQLAGKTVKIRFTPHLLPVRRGILSTIYVTPIRRLKNEKIIETYKQFYRKSPFVKILPSGESPRIKSVVGTNDCHISLHYDDHAEVLVIISVIDNLIKGASGQALQCFNLMSGFPEDTGLTHLAMTP